MKVELHIVAGSLKRRKLICEVSPELRPTPQMVREALFSILGNAIPEQPFLDVFAGTGVIGFEAISRGAGPTMFIERDNRLAGEIDRHLRAFRVENRGRVFKGDAYRWSGQWRAPNHPVNVFISPPFPDYQNRLDDLVRLVGHVQTKAASGSVVVLQMEKGVPLDVWPRPQEWELRRYGRNILLIWQEPEQETEEEVERNGLLSHGEEE